MNLTDTQRSALGELEATCDERLRYYGSEWVRSRDLGGTKNERSTKTLHALVALGLAEGKKADSTNQAQYLWRITDAGRLFLTNEGTSP